MNVKLLTYTKDPEKTVAAAAKLCYSKSGIETLMDGLTDEKVANFLEKLASLGHNSPTEMAVFTFGIEGVSRSFLAQITRHRMASFCLSGDTIVGYSERNKDMTIRELAEKTQQYISMSKLRSINEETKEIFNNNVVNAWCSGEKPVYRITTEDGYEIKATLEHQFFVGDGYKQLGELHAGDVVYTNGIPAYKSKDWLYNAYRVRNLSQEEIAEICGVSKHTIRAWVRKFDLQKPMGSWCIGKEPVNKGKTKKDYEPMKKTSERMMGNQNNKNRVYQLNEHPNTIDGGYFLTRRKYKKTGVCSICGRTGYTELHHKDRNPMNTSPENVIELCMYCHKIEHHGAAVMASKPSIIKSIEYVGVEKTYDVEMEAPFNNFVANGFIVHNCVQSQRYVDMDNADHVVPKEIYDAGYSAVRLYEESVKNSFNNYNELKEELTRKYIAEGMKESPAKKKAQEDARYLLPEACCTRMIVTMNARELNHFFNLRCCNRASREIREVAEEMLKLVYPVAPHLFKSAGPSCVCGVCPEGNMSCGKAKEMREKYNIIKNGENDG